MLPLAPRESLVVSSRTKCTSRPINKDSSADDAHRGHLLLSQHGALVFASAVARRLSADVLILSEQRLRACSARDDVALQDLIRNAAARAANRPGAIGHITISSARGQGALLVQAVPLSSHWLGELFPGSVLVLLVDMRGQERWCRHTLQTRYDLTPAEATIVMRIPGSRGLKTIAEQLGISLATVRCHLQRAFEKTGTHRQAELVQLLAELGAGMGPPTKIRDVLARYGNYPVLDSQKMTPDLDWPLSGLAIKVSGDQDQSMLENTSSGPSPLLRFSSSEFPAPKRVEAWREVFGRALLRVNIEPLRRENFHAEATAIQAPGLGLLYGSTSPVHQGNSPELISSDDLGFGVVSASRWSASQLGRTHELQSNDGILMSFADVGSLTFAERCDLTVFSVPIAAMRPLIADLDAALARPVPAQTPALRMLMRYLDSMRDTQILLDPHAQGVVAAHVHDLLALVLGATRDAAQIAHMRGLPAARLHAIKEDVKQRLRRADLSIQQVAAAHGVSARYVQKLFEQQGTTFTEFVLGERLAHAHRLLRDPGQAALPISAIALEAGFNDLSYFNRRFRQRYGCRPSDIRFGQ